MMMPDKMPSKLPSIMHTSDIRKCVLNKGVMNKGVMSEGVMYFARDAYQCGAAKQFSFPMRQRQRP
jgi:hypothetical protein